MTEMGLLASRYASLFTNSISLASFYSDHTDMDTYNADNIINIENHRKQFMKDFYEEQNISTKTHPIMRKFNSPERDKNENIEKAKVAAV